MANEVLIVEKDKVLEAAEKCSNAKEILQTLFPKAFGTGGVKGEGMEVALHRHLVSPQGKDTIAYNVHFKPRNTPGNILGKGYAWLAQKKGKLYLKDAGETDWAKDAEVYIDAGGDIFLIFPGDKE